MKLRFSKTIAEIDRLAAYIDHAIYFESTILYFDKDNHLLFKLVKIYED